MNQQWLKKQIDNYKGDTLAEFIVGLLAFEQQIKEDKAAVDRKLYQAQKNYSLEVTGLKAELARLQKSCPHLETKYYPGASSGDSSQETCCWCGKSW